MRERPFTIGVVAPSARIAPDIADQVAALADRLYPGQRIAMRFHPQCFLSSGHFAGDDATRTLAFAEMANDPAIDALWMARGGYGACRMAEAALASLTDVARAKTYLGYSDAGFLLAGLYARGFARVAHGPMPTDILRPSGESGVARALAFLVEGRPDTLEATLSPDVPRLAFNLTILGALLGTPLEPDMAGHVLMIEEVSEHMYRIDRAFYHLTTNPGVRTAAGIRLGRCSEIPPNEPDFAQSEEQVARHWCAVSGIPYLGRADIGHDSANKVVPFGRWSGARA